MNMPNHSSVAIGNGRQVRELDIPRWARDASYTPSSRPVLSPLNMYAGSKMMAFGARKVAGKRTWPWQRKRVRQGGLDVARGRVSVYQPLGIGRRY